MGGRRERERRELDRAALEQTDYAGLARPRTDYGDPVHATRADESAGWPGKRTMIQLAARPGAPPATDDPAAPGQAGARLPEAVLARAERTFGQSFDDVRIHTDGSADDLGAIAYTRGSDLHFAPGTYDPSSQEGLSLIGHELAHVVQQRASRVEIPQGARSAINGDPSLEAEADAAGARFAAAHDAEVYSGGEQGRPRPGDTYFTPAAGAPIQRKKTKRPKTSHGDEEKKGGGDDEKMGGGDDEKMGGDEEGLVPGTEVQVAVLDGALADPAKPPKGAQLFTGVIKSYRVGSRRAPGGSYVIEWDTQVPACVGDLGSLTRDQFHATGKTRQGKATVSSNRSRGNEPAAPRTAHQEDMRAQFLAAAEMGWATDDEWDGHDDDKKEASGSESESPSDDDSDGGDEQRGRRPMVPADAVLSSLNELFRAHPEAFVPLLMHSGRVNVSDIAPTAPHSYSDAEQKRGDVVTQDTFAAFFVQRGGKLSIVPRVAAASSDSDEKTPAFPRSDAWSAPLSYKSYFFNNEKFPKSSPESVNKMDDGGIDTARKAARIKAEGYRKEKKYDYHAEEELIDSKSYNAIADQLIAEAVAASKLHGEAQDAAIEKMRTRVVVAINRTSCLHCAQVLSDWLLDFRVRLTEAVGEELSERLTMEDVFSFELASSYRYGETTDDGLRRLIRAGWELSVYPELDPRRGEAIIGPAQIQLMIDFMRLRGEVLAEDLGSEVADDEEEDDLLDDQAIEDEIALEEADLASDGKEEARPTLASQRERRPVRPTAEVLMRSVQAQIAAAVAGLTLGTGSKFDEGLAAVANKYALKLKAIYDTHLKTSATASPSATDTKESATTISEPLQKALLEIFPEYAAEVAKLHEERRKLLGSKGSSTRKRGRKGKGKQGPKPQKGKEFKNGNCLFDSVDDSGQLGVGAAALRIVTASEIRQNPIRYLPYVPHHHAADVINAVNTAADYLEGDGNWTAAHGDLAPIALAHALNRPIHILNADGSTRDIVGPNGDNPIFVYYIGLNHYISGRA